MIPSLFEFSQSNNMQLEWGPIVDGLTENDPAPTYLNDLAVTALLYIGRDPQNPEAQPGTLINSWPLPYVAGSTGLYRAVVGPVPNAAIGTSYTLFVKAQNGQYLRYWSAAAAVVA